LPTDAYGDPMLPLPEESEPAGDAYRSQCTAGGALGGGGVGEVTGWIDVGGVVVTGGVDVGGVAGGVVTTGSGVITGVVGFGVGLGAGLVTWWGAGLRLTWAARERALARRLVWR
jgi:hypothetical protein